MGTYVGDTLAVVSWDGAQEVEMAYMSQLTPLPTVPVA